MSDYQINPLIQNIPETVDRDELNAALAPVYELLGINAEEMFSSPGLSIGDLGVTFTVPAYSPTQVLPEGRELYEAAAFITVRITAEPFVISASARKALAEVGDTAYRRAARED